MSSEVEIIIVPDNVYVYRFAMLPKQAWLYHPSAPPYDDIRHPDKPLDIQTLDVEYNFELKKFPTVTLEPGKTVQVIRESDYKQLMNEKL